ncbi:MAG: 30S ribosomal protein S17e [Candidatus Aenigmatarchaeota archaeon]|nr:MAG: 30S ribosomal protein S17e [Candidatus Aenigmarchaeota archaeon]RLJ08414.1 MAG: 30S ribosomal protein S17e [Candidatus Aenigmarchaeota archaeon]RLJ09071.1 MAG: 30S ribosomal protein S17e [Candidatus Aenigmarchaeota archaeon]
MGSVKNTAIKTLGKQLISMYGEKFTDNFEKNKKVLEEIRRFKSKYIRNVLAGFITREMKKIKQSGV